MYCVVFCKWVSPATASACPSVVRNKNAKPKGRRHLSQDWRRHRHGVVTKCCPASASARRRASPTSVQAEEAAWLEAEPWPGLHVIEGYFSSLAWLEANSSHPHALPASSQPPLGSKPQPPPTEGNLKQHTHTTLLPMCLARSACSTCTTPAFAQQMRHVAVHKFFPFLSVLLFR